MEIEKFVVKFDYNKEALEKFVAESRTVDTENIEQVSDKVKEIVKMRRAIEAQGKSFRDEANAYNKNVISKEKEYTSILKPLEDEYKELIEADKQKQIIEARKELLPMKMAQLKALKQMPVYEEGFLLSLDEAQWVEYYNSQFKMNEELESQEAKEKQRAKDQKVREKEIKKEAEVKAEKDKKEALEVAAKEKDAAVEKVKKEAEDAKIKDREEDLRLEKEKEAEKIKMEKNKKYQTFLSENGFDKDTDIIRKGEDGIKIYRFVALFKN